MLGGWRRRNIPYSHSAWLVAFAPLTPQRLVRGRWLLRLDGHNRFHIKTWIVHQREIRVSRGCLHQRNFLSKIDSSESGPSERETHLPLGHLIEANECWHVSNPLIIFFQLEDDQIGLHTIDPWYGINLHVGSLMWVTQIGPIAVSPNNINQDEDSNVALYMYISLHL